MYRCCAWLLALALLQEREGHAGMREKERRRVACSQPATGVLADGDHPVCVYCSAAGTCSSIAGKSLSSPLHVTVRPAGGSGEREMKKRRCMGRERTQNKQQEKQLKGQKARERLVLASCMDFELAACMFLPIPWCPGPVLSKPR